MTTLVSAEELLEPLMDFPHVEIDNGWRIVNGERAGGWTCRIVDCDKEREVMASTIYAAIDGCVAEMKK